MKGAIGSSSWRSRANPAWRLDPLSQTGKLRMTFRNGAPGLLEAKRFAVGLMFQRDGTGRDFHDETIRHMLADLGHFAIDNG